jgi:hypothetical protein
MNSLNPELIINQTKRLVESDKQSEIRLNANGGNSILIVCNPKREIEFIAKMNQLLEAETYQIIDLNALLVNFVQANKDLLIETFELLQGSVPQVFKSSDEEGDLFQHIIEVIATSYKCNKIPVLINTGALYGSHIDNIHIMEHEVVMKSALPLIVLYPATSDGDKLLFLSKRPASKYRCMIINDHNS